MNTENNNPQLLRDSWTGNELSVVESIDTPKGECSGMGVVLATLRGPALDYVHDTRNGRGYSEALWDSVANGEYVKELKQTKNFLGEPDHPMKWEERFDIHYPYVSHAIRELIKCPEKGCYEVVIDILDTPNGRILKTLIDYGTKLGVSSRGSGSTITKNGKIIVDPRTYRFITIDVVPMPGNAKARMVSTDSTGRVPLGESLGLADALSTQVNMLLESYAKGKAVDKESLLYAKSLLESFDSPELQEVVRSLNETLDEDSSTDSSLATDLLEAYRIISSLRQEISEKDAKILELSTSGLNESSQGTYSELLESYNKSRSYVKSLLVRESNYKSQLKSLSSQLSEALEEMSESAKVASDYKVKVRYLTNEISTLKSEISKLESAKSRDLVSLQESYSNTSRDVNNYSRELSKTQNSLSEATERYFSVRCSQLGINSSVLKKNLGDLTKYSLDELDNLITESMRVGQGTPSDSIRLGRASAKEVDPPKPSRINESSEIEENSLLSSITESARYLRNN